MLALLASSSLLLLPQAPQGVAPAVGPRLAYPSDPAAAAWAAFTDAGGTPRATATRAVGAADFDGDGNVEAWHLAGDGADAGRFAVHMANAADLGRFVPYATTSASPAADATTLRIAGSGRDRVAWIDPTLQVLLTLTYDPPLQGSPRNGTWSFGTDGIVVGFGCYEIEASDDEGDGSDDVVLLRAVPLGGGALGTAVLKLRLGFGPIGYGVLETVQTMLPVPLDTLRVGDLDGDHRTDFVAHVAGLGVVAFADDRAGGFRFVGGTPLPAGALRDLDVLDVDGDGRCDWAAAIDLGVLLGLPDPHGVRTLALPRDPHLGPLGAVRLLPLPGGLVDAVMLPADGRGFAFQRYVRSDHAFDAPVFVAPPAALPGSGPRGVAACRADLDNDGDPDLALQLPDAASWTCLRHSATALDAIQVRVRTSGTVSAIGFVRQEFTITVPDRYLQHAPEDLEFAVFVIDPHTGERKYWHRVLVDPDPVTGQVMVPVQAMIDPANHAIVHDTPWKTHPITGEITCFGETVISIHGKDGTRRYGSRLVTWDGQGDPQGSAVGVKWKIVAAPPLPKADAYLLPWD